MGKETGIQWAASTFNPWRGCQKVSPGCHFCYAETLSGRNPKVLGVWGPASGGATRVVAADHGPAGWGAPRRWNAELAKFTPERRPWQGVFPSLCDPFEDWHGEMKNSQGEILCWPDSTPDKPKLFTMNDVRRGFFQMIEETPFLTWLLLTKRPENILDMVPPTWRHAWPRNCWMGTSVENQEYADKRLPHLERIPTPVRWVSYEPALGPLDFSEWLCTVKVEHNGDGDTQEVPVKPSIGWLIVGGESGSREEARRFEIEWAASAIRQCKEAGVPVFVKQLGRNPTKAGAGSLRIPLRLDHEKGGEIEEWPHELRVREMPEVAA